MKSHLAHACALFLATTLAGCGGGGQGPGSDQFVTVSDGPKVARNDWQDVLPFATITVTKATKLTALFVGECDELGALVSLRITYAVRGAPSEMTPSLHQVACHQEPSRSVVIPLLASTPKAVDPGTYVVKAQWATFSPIGAAPFRSSSLSVGPSQ